MNNKIDENIGVRHGKLVIEKLHHKDKRYQKYYVCKCDCGKELKEYHQEREDTHEVQKYVGR